MLSLRRDELVRQTWLPQVKALNIPASEHFDFALFLADPKVGPGQPECLEIVPAYLLHMRSMNRSGLVMDHSRLIVDS